MKYHFKPTPEEHLMLIDMAEALDVDLAQAIISRDLPVATLSTMLQRCSTCTDARYCDVYLKVHDHHVDHPPRYCPNHTLLDDLHAHNVDLQTVGRRSV